MYAINLLNAQDMGQQFFQSFSNFGDVLAECIAGVVGQDRDDRQHARGRVQLERRVALRELDHLELPSLNLRAAFERHQARQPAERTVGSASARS